MTDLPTKDEIVERVNPDLDSIHFRDIEAALDALTVPDLLALLKERGARYRGWYRSEGFYGARWDNCVLTVPAELKDKPDARCETCKGTGIDPERGGRCDVCSAPDVAADRKEREDGG